MDKALSCLIAFDDVSFFAGGLRDLMEGNLIFPLNHFDSPSCSTQGDRIFIDEVVWEIRFLGLSQSLLSQVLLPIHVSGGGPVMFEKSRVNHGIESVKGRVRFLNMDDHGISIEGFTKGKSLQLPVDQNSSSGDLECFKVSKGLLDGDEFMGRTRNVIAVAEVTPVILEAETLRN